MLNCIWSCCISRTEKNQRTESTAASSALANKSPTSTPARFSRLIAPQPKRNQPSVKGFFRVRPPPSLDLDRALALDLWARTPNHVIHPLLKHLCIGNSGLRGLPLLVRRHAPSQ